ncbi:MAG: hypothetical protein ACK4UO_15165 [Pseudolabrys sp.]
MRKMSRATVATILGVALYFTFSFGYDALRAFMSPSYGLDDVWRSQAVFALGGYFGLGPLGLVKLAAFIATVKLTIACACALHIADRFRALAGGTADAQIFEGGLILVVLLSIASAGPAVWSNNSGLVREQAIQLVLAGLAAALCAIERNSRRVEDAGEESAAVDSEAAPTVPAGAKWFSPWR